MTDGDALHAAILAAPDDDTPRLVYADWLQENDRPERAEFIRLQIAMARLMPHELVAWNMRTIEMQASEKALLAAHGEEWLAPLRAKGEPFQSTVTHGQFCRGFVEIVWMPATWFRARAEVTFQRIPVRELRVTQTTEAEFGGLMEYPLLGRLRGLDLSDRRLGDRAAGLLAWSPFTGSLRVLRLRGCGITDSGAHQLTEADFGGSLLELDVSHNPISRAGVAALRDRFGDAVHAAGMEWTG